jgi:hypothetical protein
MKKLIVLLVIAFLATPAMAQPWYARGDFNGWGTTNELVWDGSRYAGNVSLPGPAGSYFEFKVANADWSMNYPPDNVKMSYPALSSMNFYFYPGAATDSSEWFPRENRVGFDVAGNGWKVIGGMDGWSSATPMTDLGNGLYQLDLTIATAGHYEFKFRGTDDWEVSIGAHFGRFAPNASFDTLTNNAVERFELDLPNGRARAYTIPEPATLSLLLIGGLAMLRRRS